MNQQARGELERAVALDPTFENGYELAIACLNLGDQPSAANLFHEMASSFGDTARMPMYFGQAYLNSDSQSKAVQEFQKALVKDSRLRGAHYSLAAAYPASAGDSKLTEAEAELRKEMAVSPQGAMAYAALGHLETTQQNYTQAERYLKRAVVLDPSDPDSYLYLGQLYSELKQPAEAETAFRSSIRLTTDVARNHYQVQKAHYLLGRLLIQAGKTEEGKKELQVSQALTLQNLARAHDRLADYIEESSGTNAGASSPVRSAETSVHFDPQLAQQTDAFEKQVGPPVADSYNNLGAIAGSSNEYEEALGYFQRAPSGVPHCRGWTRVGAALLLLPVSSSRLSRRLGDIWSIILKTKVCGRHWGSAFVRLAIMQTGAVCSNQSQQTQR